MSRRHLHSEWIRSTLRRLLTETHSKPCVAICRTRTLLRLLRLLRVSSHSSSWLHRLALVSGTSTATNVRYSGLLLLVSILLYWYAIKSNDVAVIKRRRLFFIFWDIGCGSATLCNVFLLSQSLVFCAFGSLRWWAMVWIDTLRYRANVLRSQNLKLRLLLLFLLNKVRVFFYHASFWSCNIWVAADQY